MKRFKNILVCLKETEHADHPTVERAAKLAKHNQAALKLMHVIEEPSWLIRKLMPTVADAENFVETQRREALEKMASALRDERIQVSTAITTGSVFVEVIREVLRTGHDLVFVTAAGGEPHREFFGSTAMRLLRKCPCPVWVLPPHRKDRFESILASIDPVSGDPTRLALDRKILELSRSLSESEEAELCVLHVWDLFGSNVLKSRMPEGEFDRLHEKKRRENSEAFEKIVSESNLPIDSKHVTLEEGDPGYVIPEVVNQKSVDLVVMGTVARTGVPGFIIGNTAEKVLGQLTCSVLAIKPDGFVSPVTLD